MSEDLGEQSWVLTGIQLRSSANFHGRDWCNRRSMGNKIDNIRNTAEKVREDLKRRWSRGTTEVVMTYRKNVNDREIDETLNDITPVFLIVSLTLFAVAHLMISLAS